MEIIKTWSDFKTLVSDKGLLMQYEDYGVGKQYHIWVNEAGTCYHLYLNHTTTPAGGSDEKDWTDNYKSGANKPIASGEDTIMDAVAIRDTNATYSNISDNRGFVPKTIIIENGLDQQISCQIQGSRTSSFTKAINIGSSFDIATVTDGYQTVSDYFPYFRICITASVTPTTGSVTVYLERVKA